MDGNLEIQINSKFKERYVVLYNSILLICKPLKGKYSLETAFLMSELEIRDDYETDYEKSHQTSLGIQLFIISEDMNVICLNAKNDIMKAKWLESFQMAFTSYNQQSTQNFIENKDIYELQLKEFRNTKRSILSSSFMNTIKTKVNSFSIHLDDLVCIRYVLNYLINLNLVKHL